MLNRSSFQQTPTFIFFYSAKHHYIATSTMAFKANHKTYRSHTVSYICFWKWCHQWCLSYCKSGTFNVWGLCSFYFVYFLTESLCVLEHQLLYLSRSNFRWINQISNHSHGSENKKFWPLFVKIFSSTFFNMVGISHYGKVVEVKFSKQIKATTEKCSLGYFLHRISQNRLHDWWMSRNIW